MWELLSLASFLVAADDHAEVPLNAPPPGPATATADYVNAEEDAEMLAGVEFTSMQREQIVANRAAASRRRAIADAGEVRPTGSPRHSRSPRRGAPAEDIYQRVAGSRW